MQVKAKLSHLRQSPRKVRLVADAIRGLDVAKAESILRFSGKSAAKPLLKLLESAIANAKHNDKLEKDNLFIEELRVDEGPSLKRWRPRAFGRASAIRKRTSHISLILGERVPTKDKKAKKKDSSKPKEKVATKVISDLKELKESDTDEKDIGGFSGQNKSGKSESGGKKGSGFKQKIFNRKAG